ncbi:MAG: hypothetical protein ACN6O3_17395 [Comamonas sp.]
MPSTTIPPRTFTDPGALWHRNQVDRLRQKQLQFGQHIRLDADAILRRLARMTQATRAAAPCLHLEDFKPIPRRDPAAVGEWMATLPDGTEVVVADAQGAPCPRGLAKAASVVQSCTYLEPRARQLLALLLHGDDAWQLVALDFGTEAQRQRCEFLMGFALEPAPGTGGAFAEIKFALPRPSDTDPVFVLTLGAVLGL